MKKRILLTLITAAGLFNMALAAGPITFDWIGTSSTTWESPASWKASDGSTTNYPGSGSRTTDIVRFGVTGSSFTKQPTLATAVTVASIEFGGGIQSTGTLLTVNGVNLTVTGAITQDINTNAGKKTYFDYLQGTGGIICTGINLGSGTAINGSQNYLLSDIATLTVNGNITLTANIQNQNGSGFRLENGNMYLSGTISFANTSAIATAQASKNPQQQNDVYFTINTITQALGAATTPHLYLSNQNAITSIPTPWASVNFYGDPGGTGIVTYTAASPTIYTTATPGFGTGGGTIDTAKTNYDNLVINGSGVAQIGGGTSTVGTLNVGGDLTTSSPATFSPSGAATTNTTIGGNWNNTSTITGGPGTTGVDGSLNNSGAITFSTGNVDVGTNITNSGTLNAGTGNLQVDGSLSNSANLTLSSGTLTVAGNYANSGTFTAGTGPVDFIGSSPESLVDNSTTGTTLNTVNFSGGGTKTLSGTGSFAVSSFGVLTMATANTLQTGGILTLNSASTGSATIAALPSTAKITGNVNVQRYISGGNNSYRGYRFLSSPIYTASSGTNYYFDFSYLPRYAPLTGTTGTAGGFTKSGNPTIYLYRDNVVFTNSTFNTGNFRGVNAINNTPLYNVGVDYDGNFNVHPGTGFFFFYRGNLSNIATKYTSTTPAEANVFVSTGVLNQQAVKVINWFTGLATLQNSTVPGNAVGYSGFNLIGNPYASSIDWNTYSTATSTAGIYAPGVGPSIYIYNEVSKIYGTYSGGLGANGASNVIPQGQGFFVKATTTTATLTFNEAAKTNAQVTGPTSSTGTTLLLSASPANNTTIQYLRLELAADSINKEETLVRFDNGASNLYAANEDAQHLAGGGTVAFYSRSADNVPLIINAIPLPKPSQTIKLNIATAASGQYSINQTELKNVPDLFDIWLKDAYKQDSLDIKHNSSYKFDVLRSDTNSYGANRFTLVIRQNPALGIHLLNFTANKTSNGALTVWKTENESTYTNFTLERSTNGGVNFEDLGTLQSNSLGTYNFLDKTPAAAVDQYRLKIEDLNGAITYSNVVTLMYANTVNNIVKSLINIYPNPAKSMLNLAISQTAGSGNQQVLQSAGPAGSTATASNAVYGIKIISSAGSVVKTVTTTQASWSTDVSGLIPGTYIIEVINNSSNSVVGKGTFIKL